jgi:BirA family biotin operon repressor/biotin-[acetyl-CoA-carboxylase] ligase
MALVAGLAARDALGAAFGSELSDDRRRLRIGLKWPNDLMMGERKVGGILSEADDDRLVVGLGVNLFWPGSEAPEGVAGVLDSDPGDGPIQRLAAAFAEALLARSQRQPDDWGRDEYRECSVTIGRWVRWEPAGSGRALDIGPRGELVVSTAEGRVMVDSGEVWHLRPLED